VKAAIFHREARAELEEAVAYYERQKPGLGTALLSIVQETVSRIEQNPRLGGRYKATPFRHFLVRRFPYVIFYTERESGLWIVAVAHGKRRPDYWRRRRIP